MAHEETSMASLPFHFDVLVEEQPEGFVAHCLQLDIVAVADSRAQVLDDMGDLIRAQLTSAIENDNLGNVFHPAPPEVWGRLYQLKGTERPACSRQEVTVREKSNEADFCYA